MTTSELSNNLIKLLKKYIKDEGYYSSGRLYKSINFKVTDSASSGLDVQLDSLPYINYLDDGKLLDKFFAQKVVTDLFYDYGTEQIMKSIEDIDI